MQLSMAMSADNQSGSRVKFLVFTDNTQAYESEWLETGQPAVSWEIDVSGVQEVRIVCTTETPAFCYGIAEATLYAAVESQSALGDDTPAMEGEW